MDVLKKYTKRERDLLKKEIETMDMTPVYVFSGTIIAIWLGVYVFFDAVFG